MYSRWCIVGDACDVLPMMYCRWCIAGDVLFYNVEDICIDLKDIVWNSGAVGFKSSINLYVNYKWNRGRTSIRYGQHVLFQV